MTGDIIHLEVAITEVDTVEIFQYNRVFGTYLHDRPSVRPSTIHPFVRRSKHALVFGDLNSLHDKDYNDGDNNNKIINKVCFVYFFCHSMGCVSWIVVDCLPG